MSNNLPTLRNTWEFSLNNVAGTNVSTLQSYQETIFRVKEVLTNLSSNPWSVYLSSNSVNYSNDGGTVILPYEDQSSNGFDGTPVGIETGNITSDVPGGSFSTRSTTFDSSSEYITMGNVLNFNPDEPFSVSIWFKKSVGGDTYMVSKFTGSRGWNIKLLGTGAIEFYFADAFASRLEVESTTTGLNDGFWHHVVVTYDGSEDASGVSIYIDGSSDTTSTVANALGSTTTNTSSFNISGYSDGLSGEFNGQIDDVSIFDRELTSGNVTTIYNSGSPDDLTATDVDGYLVGYWLMGDGAVTSTPVDTWFSRSNVVWATPPTARAWIVLQHPTKNTQILFDCDNGATAGRIASTYISLGGLFTGGTTTTRPIAVDEIEAGDGENWNGLDASSFDSWVHVWQTDDASKTRVLVTTDSSEGRGMFWLFDEIDSFADQWENQFVAMICQAKSSLSVTSTDLFAVQNSDFNQNAQINPFISSSNSMSFFGGQLTSNPNTFSKSSTLFNADGSGLVDENINCGNVLAFDNTDPFSISCWFRCTITPSTVRGLVSKLANASPSTGYGLSLNADGQIVWELINDDVTNHARIETVDSFEDGEWHHVVATYDGYDDVSGMAVYVDGVEQSVTTTYNNLTSSIIDTDPLRLGAYGATFGWAGHIDDIAIFDGYLDSSDVLDIYNDGEPRDERIESLSGNLVGYWLMGDAADGYGDTFPTIEDVSGNGYDGTAQNMEGWEFPHGDTPGNPIIYFRLASPLIDNDVGVDGFLTSRAASGVHNELDGFPRIKDETGNNHATSINMEFADISDGMLFDGSNEYITAGPTPDLEFDISDPFTIIAWVNVAAGQGGEIVSKMLTGNGAGYMFYNRLADGFLELDIRFNASSGTDQLLVYGGTTAIDDGSWHQVAVVYDGSGDANNVLFWVDTTQQTNTVTTNTLSTSFAPTGADLEIGARTSASAYYQGSIDNVSIFSTELNTTQIEGLFNAGQDYNIFTDTDGYLSAIDDGYFEANWKLNDVTLGSYPCAPVGIFSDYGYNGFYGFLEDLYWGPDILDGSPGDTFPNDPDNRLWVNAGNFLFPYPGDNTVPSFGTLTATSSTHDLQLITSSAGGGGRTKYFQMEGIDTGNPSQPAYHNWVVTGAPDPTGAQAIGSKAPPFGGPLTNINVSAEWID